MAGRPMLRRFIFMFRSLSANRSGDIGTRSHHVVRQLYWRTVKSWHLITIFPAAGFLHSMTMFKQKSKPGQEKSQAEVEAEQIINQADTLYCNHEYECLLKLLRENCKTENDEILWRLARALSDNSKLTEDKALKKKLVFEAFEVIKKALDINNNNYACHKWYAILLDKTAEYEGTKARISNAYVVKQHFLRASELNPDDATTWYTLGVWCFLFADMPWYQRKIASALFATPPTSTYQEALQYFKKAEEMEANFYSKNLMMLGKTYSRLGDKKMAMVYLTRAFDYTIKTPDDKDAHKEAGILLSKLGVKLQGLKGYM